MSPEVSLDLVNVPTQSHGAIISSKRLVLAFKCVTSLYLKLYSGSFFKTKHKIFTMGQIQCLPPAPGSQVVSEDLYKGWVLFQGRKISLRVSGFPILKYEWSPLPTDLCTCKNMKGMCLMYIYGNEVDSLCCELLELSKALEQRHYRRQTHSHLWYLF